MIAIKYKCDETGQEMDVSVNAAGDNQAEIKIVFDPVVSDSTKDPYGIMSKLFDSLQPNSQDGRTRNDD